MAAAAVAYSIGAGLSQLAMIASGVEDLGARSPSPVVVPVEVNPPTPRPSGSNERATLAIDRPDTTLPPAADAPLILPAPAPIASAAVAPQRDDASFKAELEKLLADDPEALETVRKLLSERDPAVLAENMRVLRDTFAVD
jgi:hypothetical protein